MSFTRFTIQPGRFETLTEVDTTLPSVQIKTYRKHDTERGIMLEDIKLISTAHIPPLGAMVEGYEFGAFHKVRELRYTYTDGWKTSITVICEFPKDNSLNC